jgi:hypothetical protein
MSHQDYVKQLNPYNNGMIFQFAKDGDQFYHTMCEGELMYKLGCTRDDIVGKTLYDFLPAEYANYKIKFYEIAWNGDPVIFQCQMNGIIYLTSMKPIFKNGKVIEASGTCIDLTSIDDFMKQNPLRIEDHPKDLMIKYKNKLVFILLDKILFIERVGRKTFIHTHEQKYETNESLNGIFQSLDSRFCFSQRSYIINMDNLEMIMPLEKGYLGKFKRYDLAAKISKLKMQEIQKYKLVLNGNLNRREDIK